MLSSTSSPSKIRRSAMKALRRRLTNINTQTEDIEAACIELTALFGSDPVDDAAEVLPTRVIHELRGVFAWSVVKFELMGLPGISEPWFEAYRVTAQERMQQELMDKPAAKKPKPGDA